MACVRPYPETRPIRRFGLPEKEEDTYEREEVLNDF